MPEVKVYTLPTCPHCHQAKEFLLHKNIPFTDFNVAEDTKARDEMIQLTNQRSVPVIIIDGKIIIGFDQHKINEALAQS